MDFVPVERFEGAYLPEDGKVISFKRVWGANDHWEGHRFTDQECEDLLAGKSLAFSAVSKKGSAYEARGRLLPGVYSGHAYYGFTLCSDVLPDAFLGHTFTDEEKNILESEQGLKVEDLMSKKGRPFPATLYWQDKSGGAGKEIKMVLPDRKK